MHTRGWKVRFQMSSNPNIHCHKGNKGGSLREVKQMLALDRMKVEKPRPIKMENLDKDKSL